MFEVRLLQIFWRVDGYRVVFRRATMRRAMRPSYYCQSRPLGYSVCGIKSFTQGVHEFFVIVLRGRCRK